MLTFWVYLFYILCEMVNINKGTNQMADLKELYKEVSSKPVSELTQEDKTVISKHYEDEGINAIGEAIYWASEGNHRQILKHIQTELLEQLYKLEELGLTIPKIERGI